MRVAYVCMDPGIPVFGTKGASVHVQEWIRAAGQSGAKVELFAARLDGVAPRDLAPLPTHLFPVEKKHGVVDRERAIEDADGRMSAALRRRGPFDLVYTRHALFCCGAMGVARERGWIGIEEVNAPLVEEQRAHRRLANEERARALRREAFSRAHAIVTVSDALSRQLRRETKGTPITTIPNGVNLERFRPGVAPTWPRPPGAFVIGFVGSLKPWHGLAGLLDAFTRLRRRETRSHLLIVGDGPERGDLVARVEAAALAEHVSFVGARAPGDVPGFLASMDAAVAPYPSPRMGDPFYFSPLKVLEYLAMGLPVVASRVGQIEDTIRCYENGLLVAPGEPAALAAALERVAGDPLLVRRLSEGARQRAAEHSWIRVVQRTFAVAHALMAGARS